MYFGENSQSHPSVQPCVMYVILGNRSKEFNERVYPDVNIKDFWFHFTHIIWHQTKILRRVHSFHSNQELSTFVRLLISIHFLPSTIIQPTYSLLNSPTTLASKEMVKLEKHKLYFT